MARTSRKNIVETVEPVYQFVIYNTAIYIRLSVEDNKKRGNSIETQQYVIENFIALHPEFKTFDLYIDNGTTGTNFARPAFKRMMADVEAGKVNCIIVKDLSRLGRNVIDTGYYLERYFPLKKVRFIAVNDDYDSADPKDDGIMLPLKNMINEAYSLDISKKIRTQAKQSMMAGDYVGGRAPYGYCKAPDNCHKLLIDEEAAAVVRLIFQWAYDRVGINTIVKRLNAAEILPPSQYAAKTGKITHENLIGSGAWQTRTVSKLLATDLFTGDMVQGKMKTIDHKQYPVDEKDWIVVRNTHEAIISREMFDAVKTYREQVAVQYIQKEKAPFSENLLKGKIFCGDCKKSIHRQRCHEVYVFHCISNSRIEKGYCSGAFIKENDLFDAIMCIIRKEADILLGKNQKFQGKSPVLEAKRVAVQEQIKVLMQGVDKNQGYLKGLYENLSRGIINREDYTAMKADYTVKIQRAMGEISILENEQKELDAQAKKFSALTDSVKHIPESAPLTAELVERLIERIDLNSDKTFHITFRFENAFQRIDEVCGHA